MNSHFELTLKIILLKKYKKIIGKLEDVYKKLIFRSLIIVSGKKR
ncbi:MAG: hypothetical protein K0R54_5907 [Clostridiaceae bacterium]|nr:hypothetical protein [Clostridiaceae bacterium]